MSVREEGSVRSDSGRLMLPVILTAQFVTPLSISGTAIALPEISNSLGSSATALQWVVNGFNVAFALFALIWGAIGDRLGYRVTFRVGGACVVLASLISALAPHLIVLDLARMLAGIGAAAVLTGATSILSNAYEGAARGRAFALFGTVNGLGLALGPSISGFLLAAFGWRGVFTTQGVVVALTVLASGAIPHIKHEAAAGQKVFDASLLRNREFLAMCLVPVGGSLAFVTLLTYLPSALSGVLGMRAGSIGVFMLAMTLPVLIAPTLVGKLTSHPGARIDVRHVVAASFVCLVAGSLLMLLVAVDRSAISALPAMILLGFGFGLPIGLVDGHALAVVPPERSGTAAGVLNFFRIGSEAACVAVYGFAMERLIARSLPSSEAQKTAAGQFLHPHEYANAFHGVVSTIAALTVGLALIVLLLQRGPRNAAATASA